MDRDLYNTQEGTTDCLSTLARGKDWLQAPLWHILRDVSSEPSVGGSNPSGRALPVRACNAPFLCPQSSYPNVSLPPPILSLPYIRMCVLLTDALIH